MVASRLLLFASTISVVWIIFHASSRNNKSRWSSPWLTPMKLANHPSSDNILEDVLALNSPNWNTVYGGLGICNKTWPFFLKAASEKNTVCEIGMGSGVSTALFLMAGASTVHTFDLGDVDKKNIISYLNIRFPGRIYAHFGSFLDTVPPSNVKCDVLFVDALHPQDVIISMKYLVHRETLWLYHNGGSGETKARDFLLKTYKWNEIEESITPRSDGKKCSYYLGKIH